MSKSRANGIKPLSDQNRVIDGVEWKLYGLKRMGSGEYRILIIENEGTLYFIALLPIIIALIILLKKILLMIF